MRPNILTLSFAIFVLSLSILLSSAATPVFAQTTDTSGGLDVTAPVGGFTKTTNAQLSLNSIIAQIIKTILTLTGVIFLGLIIWAGNLWMTAGGNEEQVGQARTMLTNAVIGLVGIFAAYALTNFVVTLIAGYVSG